jgi:hypothetical protein
MVEARSGRQPGCIDFRPTEGRQTMLQRFWLWLFALYSAAALPLLAWALANLAS